jgi:ATP-binding cassette subfamily B protein IrtA
MTDQNNKDTPLTLSGGVRSLLPFARPDWPRYALSAVLAAAGALCRLGPLYVIYEALRHLVDGSATRADFYRLALLALVFVVAQYVLLGTSTWISHRAAFATLYRLRLRVGQRLTRVPLGFVTSRQSGAVQRTISSDVERLELFLAHALPDLVSAAVSVLALTVWMAVVDWRLALVALATVAAGLWLMNASIRRSGKDQLGEYMVAMGRMNGSLVELIRGLPVVRTFHRPGQLYAETRDAVTDAARFQARWGRQFLPLYTGFQVIVAGTVVTIVPVALILYHGGHLGAADLLFFAIFGIGYGIPVLQLTELSVQLGHLSLAAGLVATLRDAGELPETADNAQISEPAVEFDQASFRYPGEQSTQDALHEVSFRAAPGTVTALVGPSGAGKTTVARLICRFYDADAGTVRVGGTDVRDMPFAQLMEQVAFVFQETFLFDDTVAANLRLAKPDATDAELVAAARAARIHDTVMALPDGYDTRLGERGSRLSGGERQRLAIARALLKGAPIIVLDEATAFVDPENELALQEAITALTAGRTVVMVAHRLSTVAGVDQLLVLDGGRIVERGRHHELLARGGLYARMWAAFEGAQQISVSAAVHAEEA